jgi:hypothetical protein
MTEQEKTYQFYKRQVNKTNKIIFRISPLEKEKLTNYCKAHKIGISFVIRMAIDKLINNK